MVVIRDWVLALMEVVDSEVSACEPATELPAAVAAAPGAASWSAPDVP